MKPATVILLAILPLLFSVSCGRSDRAGSSSATSKPNVVSVSAIGLSFEAPDRIPSGWVTFRFENESPMTHFAVLEHVPDGVGLEQHQKQVAPVFQDAMNFLTAGKRDSALAQFARLPAWAGKTVFWGGPGLTAPGGTCDATVRLTPGTYLMECYMKTAGVFHSYSPDPSRHGMVHQFTVTDESSGAAEPKPTLTVTISSERGIEMAGTPVEGENIVAIHYEDQKVHENFVGHDVHLAALAADTNLDSLVAWMDWMRPTGLQTPAPAEFVGGLEEMPAGQTGYLTVTLEPGRYAWISEVPGADKKGMLRTFTVPAGAS